MEYNTVSYEKQPVEGQVKLSGIVVYFTLFLDSEVKISSAPWLHRTHWPKIIYLRKRERYVTAGDQVRVSVGYLGGAGLTVSII